MTDFPQLASRNNTALAILLRCNRRCVFLPRVLTVELVQVVVHLLRVQVVLVEEEVESVRLDRLGAGHRSSQEVVVVF